MKKIKKILAMLSVVTIMCSAIGVFAEPDSGTKEKYGSGTNTIIGAANNSSEDDNKGETKKSTSTSDDKESTESESSTKTKTTTEKASESKTETKTQTTTEKKTAANATKKATQEATKKTEQKTETKTVATIKPTEKTEEKEDTEKKETLDEDVKEEAEGEETEDEEKETPKPTMSVEKTAEQINANKYLTKTGAFGMFILTVLVSAIVSFLISYRFYKMKKTDNYLSSEIRALKRDIDTKMAGLVNGVSEYETKTSNSNPNYSMDANGITIEETEDDKEEAVDMYSKWEKQINSRESARREETDYGEDSNTEESRARRERYQKNDRLQNTKRSSKFGSSKGRGTYPDRFSRDK